MNPPPPPEFEPDGFVKAEVPGDSTGRGVIHLPPGSRMKVAGCTLHFRSVQSKRAVAFLEHGQLDGLRAGVAFPVMAGTLIVQSVGRKCVTFRTAPGTTLDPSPLFRQEDTQPQALNA